MKVTLRPIRSASRPQNSSRLPNDREYAVTTHCLSTLLKPSACCADGRAMFMTVMSRTTMSWAIPITARISQRRLSGCPAAPAPAPAVTGTLISDMRAANLEGVLPRSREAAQAKRRRFLR